MNLRFTRLLKKFSILEDRVNKLPNIIRHGYLASVNGLVIECIGLRAPVGAQCFIERIINSKKEIVDAEVIGFSEGKTILLSFEKSDGFYPGSRVFLKVESNMQYVMKKIPLSTTLLGRVLNGNGFPLDDLPNLKSKYYNIIQEKNDINPLHRKSITEVLDTGIRTINSLLTIGKGQRIGIFSSPGLGKSILLQMLIKNTQSDVIVIALIGERAREVKEFVKNVANSKSLSKSVIIAAPADTSPLLRTQAATYATSVAEYFCRKNKNVLLIMDSLTRYAIAEREISLALGDFPVSKGYPASIFSKIPKLLERAGNINQKRGSITAFYTVLMENSEEQDIVSHLARSILDGHILLSRYYAELGHYPAIDIESSISRVMPDIIDSGHYQKAVYFKKLIAVYQRNRDLINVGAYIKGTDLFLDHAIEIWPKIEKFLRQEISENIDYSSSCKELNEMFL